MKKALIGMVGLRESYNWLHFLPLSPFKETEEMEQAVGKAELWE